MKSFRMKTSQFRWKETSFLHDGFRNRFLGHKPYLNKQLHRKGEGWRDGSAVKG